MDEDEDFFVADRIDYDNENCPRTEWTPINAPSSDQSSTCQQCKDHDDFDDAVYYMNSGDGTYSISSGSDEDSIPWQAALKLRELSKRRRSELSQDPESYAKVENSGDAWKDAWEG